MRLNNPWLWAAMAACAAFWAAVGCVAWGQQPMAPACLAYQQHVMAAYVYQWRSMQAPNGAIYAVENEVLNVTRDLLNNVPDDPQQCAYLDKEFQALKLPTAAVKDTRFSDSENLIDKLKR